MKKLYIFDFDGTLFDSVWDVVECFNQSLLLHDFPTLTHEEYIERLGGNIDEIVSLILKDNNTPENIELIKNTYNRIYGECDKHNTVPFDGVNEVLKQLENNNKILAINSNRTTPSIEFYVEKFFKDINFIEIEGHNAGYPSKPSPLGVEKIIGKANVKKNEAIYIGDSKTDIKTAKNAGIDCLIVKWGYGNDKDYEDDYILDAIDGPSQIINYF